MISHSTPRTILIQQLSSVEVSTHSSALVVALAGISRFQLRFLPRRNKMRVLLIIFYDLLGDHLALKAPQCVLDGFIIVYFYVSQTLSHSLLLSLHTARASNH